MSTPAQLRMVSGDTAPTNPPSGTLLLYFKTDGNLYIRDSTGTETQLDTGAIGGTVGTTDNAVPRADGTGGSTLQASGVTIDDSDNVTGVAQFTATGQARFQGNLVSQSDNFIVRSNTAGGTGVGSNPVFYFLNGDYQATGVDGFGFFFDNFSTGDYQVFKATNGAFGTGLIRMTATGAWGLTNSIATPATTGYPQLWNNSGELIVKDSAGNVTTLSPHPQNTMVDTAGRVTTHVYREENAYTGRVTELDIVGALMDLEASTGNTYIYEDRAPLMQRENKLLSKYKQKRRKWRERKVS